MGVCLDIARSDCHFRLSTLTTDIQIAADDVSHIEPPMLCAMVHERSFKIVREKNENEYIHK